MPLGNIYFYYSAFKPSQVEYSISFGAVRKLLQLRTAACVLCVSISVHPCVRRGTIKKKEKKKRDRQDIMEI